MVMITPEVIHETRIALGDSAERFGARLGVTGNTVFRWESGERHPKYEMQIRLNLLIETLLAAQKELAVGA